MLDIQKKIETRLNFPRENGAIKTCSLNNILTRVHLYINYGEELLAEKVENGRGARNLRNSYSLEKDKNRPRGEGDRGSHFRFSSYNPINTLRETILQECANTDFNDSKIRNSYSVNESNRIDKTRFCHFHKSNLFDTLRREVKNMTWKERNKRSLRREKGSPKKTIEDVSRAKGNKHNRSEEHEN